MFLINIAGNETIYEQIRKQIIRFIETGVLKANDKLPSCRDLASQLGINPNTVNKAYKQLEDNGYIYTINKKGAFVKERENDNADLHLANIILPLKNYGVNKNDLLETIEEIYKEEKC